MNIIVKYLVRGIFAVTYVLVLLVCFGVAVGGGPHTNSKVEPAIVSSQAAQVLSQFEEMRNGSVKEWGGNADTAVSTLLMRQEFAFPKVLRETCPDCWLWITDQYDSRKTEEELRALANFGAVERFMFWKRVEQFTYGFIGLGMIYFPILYFRTRKATSRRYYYYRLFQFLAVVSVLTISMDVTLVKSMERLPAVGEDALNNLMWTMAFIWAALFVRGNKKFVIADFDKKPEPKQDLKRAA